VIVRLRLGHRQVAVAFTLPGNVVGTRFLTTTSNTVHVYSGATVTQESIFTVATLRACCARRLPVTNAARRGLHAAESAAPTLLVIRASASLW
jgi:hypothetical protein